MEEIVEIILRAVDEASNMFSNVSSSAEEMGSAIENSTSEGSSGFDTLDSAAESASTTIQNVSSSCDSIDGTNITDVATAMDELEMETTESSEAIAELGSQLDIINAGMLLQTAEQIGTIGEEVSSALWAAADSAGSFSDSVDRASIEAEGFGISASEMSSMVSELSSTTGRAGGQIREAFITSVARGITDMDSFKSMMEGVSAQAYLLGTDINTLANTFSNMAMKSKVSERQLASTGITVQELAIAMDMEGASLDELNAKWATLDSNQRAAILGMAASMNEGKDANEAYKHSWEGLKNQIDLAKGKIVRLVGDVLLPVLVPALEVAGRVLNWVGDMISAVMKSPLGGFVSVLGALAAGIAVLIPLIAAISAGWGFFTASIMPAIAASWAFIAPWLPFIAIAVAVAVAVYEIGKAFGWWTDVSTMIDAIWAGLQRLWSAFINHPDVQALLQALGDAWNWLTQAVGQAWQAVTDFLGLFGGEEFDVVRAIIDYLSLAWSIASIPIRAIIAYLQWLIGIYAQLYAVLQPIGAYIMDLLGPSFQALANIIRTLISEVQKVIDVFNQFMSGQADLGDLVGTILGAVWNIWSSFMSNLGAIWWNVLNTIGQLIWDFVTNMPVWAAQAGMWFLQALWNWIQQVPPMILQFLVQAAMNINTTMLRWVSEGRAKAIAFVIGIINYIRTLPQRVWDWMLATLRKIIAAGREWVDNAKQKAKEVVDGAVNTISQLPDKIANAISGVVDAIVKPFRDAYNQAKEWWDKITSFGGASAAGGDLPLAAGGDIGPISGGVSVGKYSLEQSEPIEVNQNVVLDFKNVPSHISTEQLAAVLTDPKVLRELTGSRDFQLLDGKAKEKWNLKYNRSRGV